MKGWGLRGVAAFALLAMLAYLNRETLALHMVSLAASGQLSVGPHREVDWSTGVDPALRPPAERPPNIVLILADDLGWNDLSFGGGGVAGGTVPTPNIDSIAAEGVSFSNGYAGNATCAPSRAALLSGRYGTRFGFEFTPTPAPMAMLVPRLSSPIPRLRRPIPQQDAEFLDYDSMGMPASEITIAELLSAQGYHVTAQSEKLCLKLLRRHVERSISEQRADCRLPRLQTCGNAIETDTHPGQRPDNKQQAAQQQ